MVLGLSVSFLTRGVVHGFGGETLRSTTPLRDFGGGDTGLVRVDGLLSMDDLGDLPLSSTTFAADFSGVLARGVDLSSPASKSSIFRRLELLSIDPSRPFDVLVCLVPFSSSS